MNQAQGGTGAGARPFGTGETPVPLLFQGRQGVSVAAEIGDNDPP